MERMCSDPVDVGHTLLIIAVRAGAQTGALDQQFVYTHPRFASRSKLGVMEYSSPQQCR